MARHRMFSCFFFFSVFVTSGRLLVVRQFGFSAAQFVNLICVILPNVTISN